MLHEVETEDDYGHTQINKAEYERVLSLYSIRVIYLSNNIEIEA